MAYIMHYGTPHDGSTPHSGRYPWGSGDDPDQRPDFFTDVAARIRKENPGISPAEVAAMLGMSQNEMRLRISASNSEKDAYYQRQAIKLKDKGYSVNAIAKEFGVSPGKAKAYLYPELRKRGKIVENTSDVLAKAAKEQGAIDIGAGVNRQLGVSEQAFKGAVSKLREEGYKVWWVEVEQLGTGHKTTMKVLVNPEKGNEKGYFSELKKDPALIGMVTDYSTTGGEDFRKIEKPVDISSDRVAIRYAEDGGSDKDGIIELRRSAKDLSMGENLYSQVRISVDGTHYLKGMAVYSDDIPKGKDIVFNTSKHNTVPAMGENNDNSVLKLQKNSEDNPFGAVVRQTTYTGDDGKEHLSPLNIVNAQGDWATNWGSALSSQLLSKQTISLAKRQLGKAYDDKLKEYEEISSLTNPALREYLLTSFASSCDSDAVHLKAAAMPRQSWNAIISTPSAKPNEIYAPNYNNGEKVVLVRYPHGGRFEIPELVVNNNLPEGKKVIGKAPDAVGIHPSVAAVLSGADFDGDTVLVIPNNSGDIKTMKPLKGLVNFDTKSYKNPPDAPKTSAATGFNKQLQMGTVSNLITDMTLLGADFDKIERATKHSMVIIDAEKHNLDWRASERENRIQELKDEFQGGGGAATIISRAKNEIRVDERRAGVYLIDPATGKPSGKKQYIDPVTGDLLYELTGKTKRKKNKAGEWYDSDEPKQVESTRMAEAKDARELSSGHPMEEVYADHANKLKDLARKSRLDILEIQSNEVGKKRNVAAAKEYAEEIEELKDQLNTALMNAPVERRAQAIGNSMFNADKKANPNMSFDEAQKTKAKCLSIARIKVGAGKKRIDISDRQWEAIQSGALSFKMQQQIFANADEKQLKRLATPRNTPGLSESQLSRMRSMIANGATQAQVAEALGVSVSTVNRELNA